MSLFTFLFPERGIEMHTAMCVHWLVKVGDWVKADQIILEVVTDKERIGMPSPVAGVVTKMHLREGQRLHAGAELVTFATKQLVTKAADSQEDATDCLPTYLQKQKREYMILTAQKRWKGGIPFVIDHLESKDQILTSLYPHRHAYYQIIWITQGTGTYAIDLEEYPIQANSFFLLGPNKVHCIRASSPLTGMAVVFTRDFLVFDAQKSQSLLLACFHTENQEPRVVLTDREAEQCIQALSCIEQELQSVLSGRTEIIQAYLHILLTMICRIGRIQTSWPCLTQLAQTFTALVEAEFRQKKQVSEYAELLSVTPGHLNDLVKQSLGKTAGEIIRERVLLEARRLLLYSEDSVAEIANHLDFDDPSYFCRFFRRYVHQSPGAYRAAIREKLQAQVALLA